MPNRQFLPRLALGGVIAATVVLSGCATTDADPEILLEADDAIALAQRAGASDHAPLELDEAMELRAEAAQAVSEDEPVEAGRMVQRAAQQARLAIVRAEGARARAELERKRAELEALRDELRDAFGDRIDMTPAGEDRE